MKNWLLILLILLVLPAAHAGVNIEPYLGYLIHNNEYKSTVTSALDTSYEYSYKTPLLGARLGYGMLGFSLGVDYSRSLGAFKFKQEKPASSAASDEYTNSNLGLYAGYKFPILIRVWGTYFLKNQLKLDKTGGAQDTDDSVEINGKGFALGAGWTGLPFLAINLEYRSITYDEIKQRNGTTITLPYSLGGATVTEKIKAKEIVLSASLPLDF
ncbi:MAG: outer membrane beta-barrel protein [Bdellovibrio sp.]|nr:outer membrane beta-barrel protein [Bdellovibrio sp.]